MYSWLRRSLPRSSSSKSNKEETQKLVAKDEGDEFYGVTDQLIEFVKTFTLDTFKNFSLADEDSDETQTTSGGVRVDLSDWQQRHATIVLSKVKELSKLRYILCPRHLKERDFWRIYFTLVKSYVTEHQLRAIQVDKLRKMAMENEKSSDANGIELEMTEARQPSHLAPP
uniref:BSD domain-containing protein n=1 Tax=Opuntia streptacantha TaxID=393608 RepID=A0A7C8ZAD0_OPUST